jgi:hypothetical protein
MTMEQLKQYNGTGPEGRVLVAVNGKVFDVTKGTTHFPYSTKLKRSNSFMTYPTLQQHLIVLFFIYASYNI